MKKSRRTYNGVHLNKKSNTQDVVEQSLTINLGPYSGKNCPNVRFQPTVLDRILEGTALLIVLVT